MSADSKQSQRDGESALSRWSRRKLEAREEPRREQTAPAETLPEQPAEAPPAADQAAVEAEKPVLTDADMPDIDTLDENSDYSVFMSSGVSDRLRNLALRKLFGAPAFNIRDGLDEYDEDYTSFEKLGDIVTSDMKHRVEMEQQKLREALAEERQAREGDEGETGEREALEDEHPADAGKRAGSGDEKLAGLGEQSAESLEDNGEAADDEQ